MTFPGLACRVIVVAGAAAAVIASGSSNANRPADGPASSTAAPPSQPMAVEQALGLWKTSFGPVKIEKDPESGDKNLRGVWVYDRSGKEVIGYFSGPLDGNVLQFRWTEPARPTDLVGDGYLVFDPNGQSFSGRWWTTDRARGGEWNGWRKDGGQGAPDPASTAPEGQPPRDQAPPPPNQEGPAEQAPPPEETI
jgi:hypothetical protein